MTKLDETGLAAAIAHARLDDYLDDSEVEGIITAYLDAAQTRLNLRRVGQECEQTRLAVIANSEGAAIGLSLSAGVVSVSEDGWQSLKSLSGAPDGPWRRQIVRCHLLRPEPVREISGTTEPA